MHLNFEIKLSTVGVGCLAGELVAGHRLTGFPTTQHRNPPNHHPLFSQIIGSPIRRRGNSIRHILQRLRHGPAAQNRVAGEASRGEQAESTAAECGIPSTVFLISFVRSVNSREISKSPTDSFAHLPLLALFSRKLPHFARTAIASTHASPKIGRSTRSLPASFCFHPSAAAARISCLCPKNPNS